MSTKTTISHNHLHHFYSDVFDHDHVYLKLCNEDIDFSVDNFNILVQIPILCWRQMVDKWNSSGWAVCEDNKRIFEKEKIEEKAEDEKQLCFSFIDDDN